MIVHSLTKNSISDLVEVFNASFEGYFLPVQFNEETLLDKIKSDNIFLEYSIGVSIDDQLVAFILIGIDSKNNQLLSYNAGTGVISNHRGQHLPQKMYDFLLPLLNKNNIRNHQLEVITENHKAFQVYQNIGYQISRKVTCFKGTILSPTKTIPYKIFEFDFAPETVIESFWNHQPTYQNTLSSINRNKNAHTFLGVFSENGLLGYLIYVKSTNRIKQFGVDKNYRKSSIGHHLFYEVQKANPSKEVSLINIDSNDTETISFLHKLGLTVTIEQYEMMLQQ
jgi:ribosomal protein S18 acetylase RimI-like enzyme